MSDLRQQRTIVVIGATGRQGRGVAQALLDDSWLVRGLVSDPDSDRAKQLLSDLQTPDGRFSLAKGSYYDARSLLAAFNGAYGVFAMTGDGVAGKLLTEEAEMEHEVGAGRNLIRAAKETGVQHFVFSSLPNIAEASGGRFAKVFHMDNKAAIEKLARAELDGFTSLIPGFFYTNLMWPLYCRLQPDGVVCFCIPVPSTQPMQWTDPTDDMGTFAAEIFAQGVSKTKGKTYLALSAHTTPQEIAETFTRVTGRKAVHSPITPQEFGEMVAPRLGSVFKLDTQQMMEWAAVAPADKVAYGSITPGDEGLGKLGVSASTFEEWLRRSGWTGPTEVFEGGDAFVVNKSATR